MPSLWVTWCPQPHTDPSRPWHVWTMFPVHSSPPGVPVTAQLDLVSCPAATLRPRGRGHAQGWGLPVTETAFSSSSSLQHHVHILNNLLVRYCAVRLTYSISCSSPLLSLSFRCLNSPAQVNATKGRGWNSKKPFPTPMPVTTTAAPGGACLLRKTAFLPVILDGM